MGKVKVDVSTSLDGFITGPDDRPGQELGEGGMQLHEWVFGLAAWRKPHGLEGGETGPDDDVVQQLFAAGLVDEIQLHVAPLFLGRGKRLFDELGKEIELERMRVVDSPGVTHLKYRVVK